MTSSIESEIENFTLDLRCPICLSVFKNPVCLPCNHPLCDDCASSVVPRKSKCPTCRQTFTKRQLGRNAWITDVVAKFKACVNYLKMDIIESQSESEIYQSTRSVECAAPIIAMESSYSSVKRSRIDSIDQPCERSGETVFRLSTASLDDSLCNPSIIHSECDLDSISEQCHLHRSSLKSIDVDNNIITKTMNIKSLGDIYEVSDIVNVIPRTGPGLNKPGGIARITKIYPNQKCDVKYVLSGSTEKFLPFSVIGLAPQMMEEPLGKSFRPRCAKKRPRSDSHTIGSELQISSRCKRQENCDTDRQLISKETFSNSSPSLNKLLEVEPASDKIRPHFRNLDSPMIKRQKINICVSALNPGSINRVNVFCRRFDLVCVPEFSENVTHLVVSVAIENPTCVTEKRSMKYLKSLSNGCWIVSFSWIEECLRNNCLVPEKCFEISGDRKSTIPYAPRRSRLAHNAMCPGIFDGDSFLLAGNFAGSTCTEDLHTVLLLNGAAGCTIVKPHRLKYFDFKILETLEKKPYLLLHSPSVLENEDIRTFVSEAASKIFKVVTMAWILECVGSYRKLPITSEKEENLYEIKLDTLYL